MENRDILEPKSPKILFWINSIPRIAIEFFILSSLSICVFLLKDIMSHIYWIYMLNPLAWVLVKIGTIEIIVYHGGGITFLFSSYLLTGSIFWFFIGQLIRKKLNSKIHLREKIQ